jgi:hypothetical protein
VECRSHREAAGRWVYKACVCIRSCACTVPCSAWAPLPEAHYQGLKPSSKEEGESPCCSDLLNER